MKRNTETFPWLFLTLIALYSTSYLGISTKGNSGELVTTVNNPVLDVRLIPEFDGSSHDVLEWLNKLELVCQLRDFSDLRNIVPLRLTGGAFAVYQQLSSDDKKVYKKIKEALLSAFALDSFCAYEQFVTRKLGDDESVDVYLADLGHLATMFGGIPDSGLACAFVAGLPDAARRILRAGSRMESMDIGQILCRARAVLVMENEGTAAAGVALRSACCQRDKQAIVSDITCHSCGQLNHYARDCMARREVRWGGCNVCCFCCGRRGHVASSCSGNGAGEMEPAPAFSPALQ